MYKRLNINKKWAVSIETFNDFCRKNISSYKTGYNKYIATGAVFYNFVLYKVRITFIEDKCTGYSTN